MSFPAEDSTAPTEQKDVSQTSLLLPFLVADEKRVREEALTTMLGLSGSEEGRIELVATDAPQVGLLHVSGCAPPSHCFVHM